MLVLPVVNLVIAVRYNRLLDVKRVDQILPHFEIETEDNLLLLKTHFLCLARGIWSRRFYSNSSVRWFL